MPRNFSGEFVDKQQQSYHEYDNFVLFFRDNILLLLPWSPSTMDDDVQALKL